MTLPTRSEDRPVESAASTLDELKTLLIETLGIDERSNTIDASTELLGNLPELDSAAVVELLTVIEDRFGFEVDDADISADVFETLRTLADFVEAHRT